MRTLLVALLVASAARAQTGEAVPANGVDEKPRRGAFVEASLGAFVTMGGNVPVSNGQAYLGMTVGKELGETAAVFGQLGIGASSASCFTSVDKAGNCQAADSFGLTFVEGGASFGFPLALRTLLAVKVVAGLTDLSPGPVVNGSSVPDHLVGFHLGGGLSLDYDTHLDHFAVGIDALLRYTLAHYTPAGGSGASLGLASVAVMPRIRYVF